jgi:hypothetical protein
MEQKQGKKKEKTQCTSRRVCARSRVGARSRDKEQREKEQGLRE